MLERFLLWQVQTQHYNLLSNLQTVEVLAASHKPQAVFCYSSTNWCQNELALLMT